MGEKAAKADIDAIEYIFADLDPAEGESSTDAKARYRAQLETFLGGPAPARRERSAQPTATAVEFRCRSR
jgi:hypothetical protein